MKNELILALRFTVVTTLIFGLIYPLGMTGMSRLLFPKQAARSLIVKNGRIIGSRLIGQSFTSKNIFIRARLPQATVTTPAHPTSRPPIKPW